MISVTHYFGAAPLDQLPAYGSADRLKIAVLWRRAHVLQPRRFARGLPDDTEARFRAA